MATLLQRAHAGQNNQNDIKPSQGLVLDTWLTMAIHPARLCGNIRWNNSNEYTVYNQSIY